MKWTFEVKIEEKNQFEEIYKWAINAKQEVVSLAESYLGNFANHIMIAFLHADRENTKKIIIVWFDFFVQLRDFKRHLECREIGRGEREK